MEIVSNLASGLMFAVFGILALCIGALILKLVWEVARATCHSVLEVRWARVLAHGGLGFVVSLLVAPRLGIPLAIAVAFISTLIVDVVMHKLESFEIKKPIRARR